MTDNTKTPSALERVLTALAELGPATAAKVGESIGVAYSTTTPKLRELESAGHAERIRTDQRTTLWQLTDTGKSAAASAAAHHISVEAPSGPSASDDDVAAGESQQRVNPHPEAAPKPGTATPSPNQVPDEPPAGRQTSDSTAETGHTAPAPSQAGPALTDEQVTTPQAEPEPKQAPSSGTVQEQPPGKPRAGNHAGEPETEQQLPERAEESEVNGQKGDSPRKPRQPRRRKGELREEVLALLQRNPDTAYKVGEICKLLNQANDGAQVSKASAGAVANALDKLIIAGNVKRLDTKVATYQAE